MSNMAKKIEGGLFREEAVRAPPQQGNSRISEGNVNDQDQDFQRQLALAQEERESGGS